jgi:hypothetical protein
MNMDGKTTYVQVAQYIPQSTSVSITTLLREGPGFHHLNASFINCNPDIFLPSCNRINFMVNSTSDTQNAVECVLPGVKMVGYDKRLEQICAHQPAITPM